MSCVITSIIKYSLLINLQEEHGHLVMMGVFDCVDDTVLVIKSIISVSYDID